MADEIDLGRLNFGEHVTGPEVTHNELENRFVIVEYWGVNCPPCIASIPHVTRLAEEHGHRRLVVVALHRQNATDDRVKEVWEGRAQSNHVAVFNGGNLPGFGNGRIPHAILFDPSGREIWQGSPTQVDKPLEEAMRRYRPPAREREEPAEAGPDPIVVDLELKYFAREVAQINAQSRSLAAPMAKLRNAIERPRHEDQVIEAQAVLGQVQKWAEAQSVEAAQARADDPATAYVIAERVSELLPRDELGKPFIELKRAMDANQQVMDAVRSMRMLREVIAEAEAIGLPDDPAAVVADRSNRRAIRSITRDLRRIVGAWPETDAGKQAAGLLDDWALAD